MLIGPDAYDDDEAVYALLPPHARPPILGGSRGQRFAALWSVLQNRVRASSLSGVDAGGLLQLLPTEWDIDEDGIAWRAPVCIVYREASKPALAAFDVVRDERGQFLQCRACNRTFAGLCVAAAHALSTDSGPGSGSASKDAGRYMIVDGVGAPLATLASHINDAVGY